MKKGKQAPDDALKEAGEEVKKMYEELDKRFRESMEPVMLATRREAERLGTGYLSVEHLFLALTCPETVSYKLLQACGADVNELRALVEEYKPSPSKSRKLVTTPRFNRIVDSAFDSYRRDREPHLDASAYLLQAILIEGESIPAGLLALVNVTSEKIREQTEVYRFIEL